MRTTILAMLALALLTLTTVVAFGQHEPVIEWDRTYGGQGYDAGNFIQKTTDSGYILTGITTSDRGVGNEDLSLIKTNSKGIEEWNKTFGGISYDVGDFVKEIQDFGYIIVGYTKSYGAGSGDLWLIKTDSNGTKIWDKTFGGSNTDWGKSLLETKDGEYVVVGTTGSYGSGNEDVWLIKTDSNGTKIWDKTFGGAGRDMGWSIQKTCDDEYIIIGDTDSHDAESTDVWLIKTDSEGNEVWNKTFGGHGYDAGRSIQETSDGGYVIVGDTQSYGAGGQDIWLIKVDSSGVEQWNRTFGGSENEWGQSILQAKDGGYIITGDTESDGRVMSDVWLIKTDSEGNEEWNKSLIRGGSDSVSSLRETCDGGYILAGLTTSGKGVGNEDIWLIKVKEI